MSPSYITNSSPIVVIKHCRKFVKILTLQLLISIKNSSINHSCNYNELVNFAVVVVIVDAPKNKQLNFKYLRNPKPHKLK